MEQKYSDYTEKDLQVWKTLFHNQYPNLPGKACEEYINTLNSLSSVLNANTIPNFELLDKELIKSNGWTIQVVPGLIPVSEFFQLLANKKFCSSTWLRKKDQMEYIEEPDMFHDIFGHIPLLINPVFSSFVHKFAQIGEKYVNDPIILTALQRLYWFTVEFGLINENNKVRIYGAGILSSYGETNHIFEEGVEIRPFDLQKVIETPYSTSEIQRIYYVLDNFEQLFNSLDTLLDKINNGLTISAGIVGDY